MGYGELVGNRSVHWRVRHEDAKGDKKPIKHQSSQAERGKAMMDDGDTVSIVHDECCGRDTINPTDIGKKHGHEGQFLVTLRYRTMAEASAAGNWVAKNVRPGAGGYYLTVTVPAIVRDNPDENLPAEIRIDW